MIIVDKVLKFILSNDYYNYDTLSIVNEIYNNLEKYNLARELTFKLESFLVANKFVSANDLFEKKLEQGKIKSIPELLKIAINEESKITMTSLEKLIKDNPENREILKYALGLLCRDSEKYLATALKYTSKDPDVALFGLAVSNKKEAIPVMLKNISKTQNDTFRECIKSIIALKQETQLLRIIKSSEIDIQKKIFVLNILQGMKLDNIKDSMLKIAKENIVLQPALAINALKNVKRINKEEDINLIFYIYEQLPPIYKNIIYDILVNIDWEENRLEKFISNLLLRNIVKKAVDFLKKEVKSDDLRNAVIKAIRIENSLEELEFINQFIKNNLSKFGPEFMLIRLFTRIDDKDTKFLAVQLLLEGGNSRQLSSFEMPDEMLKIFIDFLTKKRYSESSRTVSYYTIEKDTVYYKSAIEYFETLKIRSHISDIIKQSIENKFFKKEFLRLIGSVKMENGIEMLHNTTGVSNDEGVIEACLYSYRFYAPGEAYEYLREYLHAENVKLLAMAIDSLVYLGHEKIKENIEEYFRNEDFNVKLAAVKGIVKFNLPLMDEIVDFLNSLNNNELCTFFKSIKGVYSATLLEILIYDFTQREYSADASKLFFNYIKTYPNKNLIIDKLNNVLKAI